MLYKESGSFADQAVEFVMVYIDPIVLIYYCIAITVFIFATYNKPELRLFIITFLSIVISVIMMMSRASEAESIFIAIAGISSIVGIIYYRIKSKRYISVVNKNS